MIDQCLICKSPLVYDKGYHGNSFLHCSTLRDHQFYWYFTESDKDVDFIFVYSRFLLIYLTKNHFYAENKFMPETCYFNNYKNGIPRNINSIDCLISTVEEVKKKHSIYFDSLFFL